MILHLIHPSMTRKRNKVDNKCTEIRLKYRNNRIKLRITLVSTYLMVLVISSLYLKRIMQIISRMCSFKINLLKIWCPLLKSILDLIYLNNKLLIKIRIMDLRLN